MAYTPTALYRASHGGTQSTVYTVAAGKTVLVKEIIAVNGRTDDGTAVIDASLVPSGGSAGTGNRIIAQVSLAPGDPYVFPCWQILATGDFIALQGSTTGVVWHISGVVID